MSVEFGGDGGSAFTCTVPSVAPSPPAGICTTVRADELEAVELADVDVTGFGRGGEGGASARDPDLCRYDESDEARCCPEPAIIV